MTKWLRDGLMLALCAALVCGEAPHHGLGETISLHLQTDRPVYLIGQPVRVRFVILNAGDQTISFDPEDSQVTLSIVDALGRSVDSATSGQGPASARGTLGRAFISPHSSVTVYLPVTTDNWMPRQWASLGAFGYHLDLPAEYKLIANLALVDPSPEDANAYASPSRPVVVRIVSRAEARSLPPSVLNNESENSTFSGLSTELARLIAQAREMMGLDRSGWKWVDLDRRFPNWRTQRDDLKERIDALDSSGNPSSPYVIVSSNLENAAFALAIAGDRIFACDATNGNEDLIVADYYFDIVQRELAQRVAFVGDGAEPPSYGGRAGYCR
jgi:hypothetical protein